MHWGLQKCLGGPSRGLFPARRTTLIVAAVTACPIIATAQIAPPLIPPAEQAGRELQRFEDAPSPQARPGGPSITLPSTQAPEGAEDIALVIRRVEISGSTVYARSDLEPLYRDLIGRRVPLQAIYELAQRITARYGNDGYVLSRAIVPVQELDPAGATVRLEIVEGYVSAVEWPREKLARYQDFFSDYEAAITADRPINVRTLERYLLLANDLPGLRFKTALKAAPRGRGASILVVEVEDKPFDAVARLDNRGTKARGPYQFLAQGTINNLLGQHEALTLTYAGAPQVRELQLVAAGFRKVLNSEGLTLFADVSYGWGRPGTSVLELLEFKTRSLIVEGGLTYPLIRSRERNVNLTALAFMSDSTSDVLGADYNIDRLRGVRARLETDFADRFGGINQFNVTLSQGIDGLGATKNGQIFASRIAGRTDFTKVEVYASRLQPLVGGLSALIAGYGQYSPTALLVPEQCGYGGRLFGRAFDPSELLGDRCWQVSAELRYDIASSSPQIPHIQPYFYLDRGQVATVAPAMGTPGHITAASAGGGVRLSWQNAFNADLSVMKAVEGPRNDWRFFFVTTARY